MNYGGSSGFITVPSVEENGLITKSYLRGIQDSIKQRTPFAGDGIKLNVTDGGFTISTLAGAGGGIGGAKKITLTVCSNGSPSTIEVYGP